MSAKPRIYFDNAATTRVAPQVLRLMGRIMEEYYGNPSSIHREGAMARDLIEESRSRIAARLKVSPSEIFFTSGATEGINTILWGAVSKMKISRIISSSLEHSALINTLIRLSDEQGVRVDFVRFDDQGRILLPHLEELLTQDEGPTMVALMHVNNELGNQLPLKKVSELCRQHQALFFSDMVQSMGKFSNDLSSGLVDFAVASAHKFHGPKGSGFMYISGEHKIAPLLTGGSQERNMRAGTENIAGIAGMAEAFDLAYQNMETNMQHLARLKEHLRLLLKASIPDVTFNGSSKGIAAILNIGLPVESHNKMLVFNLDMEGIAVSGGSACTSGVLKISHVITALGKDKSIIPLRLSFCADNTIDEVERFVEVLKKY